MCAVEMGLFCMDKPVRLLLVEDSEDDGTLLLRELKAAGFQPGCTRVDTADAFTSALDNGEWDLVISDHALSGFSSLDALQLLKAKELDIPLIVVSGNCNEELT